MIHLTLFESPVFSPFSGSNPSSSGDKYRPDMRTSVFLKTHLWEFGSRMGRRIWLNLVLWNIMHLWSLWYRYSLHKCRIMCVCVSLYSMFIYSIYIYLQVLCIINIFCTKEQKRAPGGCSPLAGSPTKTSRHQNGPTMDTEVWLVSW